MDPWTKVHNPKTGNDEMRRLNGWKIWSTGLSGSERDVVEAEKLPEEGCDHVYVFDSDRSSHQHDYESYTCLLCGKNISEKEKIQFEQAKALKSCEPHDFKYTLTRECSKARGYKKTMVLAPDQVAIIEDKILTDNQKMYIDLPLGKTKTGGGIYKKGPQSSKRRRKGRKTRRH
tara:strand:- start:349 stop:870 length:522 start_codon:yes stop_codon:yes gene_type:complete